MVRSITLHHSILPSCGGSFCVTEGGKQGGVEVRMSARGDTGGCAFQAEVSLGARIVGPLSARKLTYKTWAK